MSEETQTNVDALLAQLKAQRDRIDAAIAALEGLSGAIPSAGGAPTNGSTAIQADEFFGMTIVEAAKKYLTKMKRPQNVQTITEALRQGGYNFATENPSNTVTSVLNRDNDKGGEVVRVSRGQFGLAAWYPGRPRRKKDDDDDSEGGAANPSAKPTTSS